MAIKVRFITPQEAEALDSWQRADDVVGYRRARILRLSEMGCRCAFIAEMLGLHVETVRWTIKAFNKGGVNAIAPRPRSGGRLGRLPTPMK
jgi:transposase